jgi:restriction system protein
MEKPFIDEKNLTLQNWLELISPHPEDRAYLILDYHFPTDALRDEYLASAHAPSDMEVKTLLRNFLIKSGSLGMDKVIIQSWLADDQMLLRAVEHTEFAKRLLNPVRPTWEGITWILDLLPSSPDEARAALSAYIDAHVQFLPDGRWQGLTDALAVIRARYFDYPHPRDVVLDLRPRDFEFLVAELFERKGFSTTVTQSSRDGGFDVFGVNKERGSKQNILVECKRRSVRFGVRPIRELGGVLESRRVNKGFFVSCGSYTGPAHSFARDNRIELIGWDELNRMLNQYLGTDWVRHIDFHITNQKRKSAEQIAAPNAGSANAPPASLT